MSRRRKLNLDTIIDSMAESASIADIVAGMRNHPAGVRFDELCKVCEHYFGPARQSNGSHRIYKTEWAGDPRINIQNLKGEAKPYQVKQVLRAIEVWGRQDEHR